MIINKALKYVLNGIMIGTLALSLQGCIVAGIGAGIAAVKYANAKKMESYNQYVIGMQRINMERVKAHMKPELIMSYEAYTNFTPKKK